MKLEIILICLIILEVVFLFKDKIKNLFGGRSFSFSDYRERMRVKGQERREVRKVTAEDVREAAQRMIRSDYVPPTQEELDEARSEDRQVTAEDVRDAARRMFNN